MKAVWIVPEDLAEQKANRKIGQIIINKTHEKDFMLVVDCAFCEY